MEKLFDYLRILIVAIGTGFTWLFGAWDTPLVVLIVFMTLDYITGFTRGYINKELSSDVGLKGIARKCVIFVVLIVAVMLDRLMNTGNWLFRSLVCYFYIANEGLSLLENSAALGVPIPTKLKDALAQLKEGNKKETISK
ncbi:phage holin family protein [Clostridium perfringens]|uniref:phage holin family protein n=1 Tax=Clostridium perfringens TaxID=1502 RepID=UPI00096A3BE9|nr:phage holin family protein [Clostridium perfringens]MDU6518918.1 phage holin family protein [Clostridioides difficile]ELC8411505.1 phage holin family protein [Clostridium perfringens]ELC8435100.1 phage holin family protein [Clostridium perfringens]MBO3312871.1 phage holin family protein [Clostridium perfringens]MDG6892683.1 Holin family protein [Clostridium perfringens]